MRAVFIDVLVDKLHQEGLGIASGCLHHFVDHVDAVIKDFSQELRDRAKFSQAYSELEEFVDRMIQDARSSGAGELHEPNFFQAKSQCGLIFWCNP